MPSVALKDKFIIFIISIIIIYTIKNTANMFLDPARKVKALFAASPKSGVVLDESNTYTA
jgi:hypothetical protein